MQVFLNRTLCKMEFVCNLLIELSLRHKRYYLSFPMAERWIDRLHGIITPLLSTSASDRADWLAAHG